MNFSKLLGKKNKEFDKEHSYFSFGCEGPAYLTASRDQIYI